MKMTRRNSICKMVVPLAIFLIFVLAAPALIQAQTYSVLYAFTGAGDGGNPGNVIVDTNGNVYGGAWFGGSLGWGDLFELHSNGQLQVLHNFTGGDGLNGMVPLIRDTNGMIYGTTYEGGVPEGGKGGRYGQGVVFRMDDRGKYVVVHAFMGETYGSPVGPLLLDGQGNLYGSVGNGIQGTQHNLWGVVFKMNSVGNMMVVHQFTGGSDGAFPNGGLIRDVYGNLYGTTVGGGNAEGYSGCGVVFKLEPAGNETVLHTFAGGTDGCSPNSGLITDSEGNFYGTTIGGGNPSCSSLRGCGTVFKLDPHGKETILHAFAGPPDGQNPYVGVVRDSAGNLYGTTSEGGFLGLGDCSRTGCGTVFKLDSSGKETLLYSFQDEVDGAIPNNVVLDPTNNLYGSASYGGKKGQCPYNLTSCGVLFKIVP